MRSHWTSPFPVYPGLHVHIMTLRGSSSFTTHSAFDVQGLILRHGLWHSPSKQASLLKQSPSVKHPVSSTTGSGTKNMFVRMETVVKIRSNKRDGLTWSTCNAIWISCIIWYALADATMSLSSAISKFRTLTWINTLVALTS